MILLVAGCATSNLQSGANTSTPDPWRVYCAEHPSREECKP